METEITLDELRFLANIPENLHTNFLRVANGLHLRAKYPKEKVFLMLVKMIHSPKKYAFSRNKMTNLAESVYQLKRSGHEITLTEDGKELLVNEEAVLTLEQKESLQGNQFELREEKLHYAVFGK